MYNGYTEKHVSTYLNLTGIQTVTESHANDDFNHAWEKATKILHNGWSLISSKSGLTGGTRGGSRTAATSKVELFVVIVNCWKPLTIMTKSSTLDVTAVLDPPLGTMMNLFPTTLGSFAWPFTEKIFPEALLWNRKILRYPYYQNTPIWIIIYEARIFH